MKENNRKEGSIAINIYRYDVVSPFLFLFSFYSLSFSAYSSFAYSSSPFFFISQREKFKDCLLQCRVSHVCANSVKESGVDQKKIDENLRYHKSLAVVSCWPCNIVNSFFFFLVFFFLSKLNGGC